MNQLMQWMGIGITLKDRERYEARRALRLRNLTQTQHEQLALQDPRRLLDVNSQPQTSPQFTILPTLAQPQPIRNVEASATQDPSTLVVDTECSGSDPGVIPTPIL